MGERKGTNKYYPPDYDPKKGGLNKFMGTHALRERARKLHLGIIIIRFEMPYNIWCEGCNNHIGMGVRYNAEKKKIGMYYSTPIYQFRMKCHLCDNHFEIKTDPANLDYVILSGARRQERRWDPTENGQVVPDDKQVIHKLADDAMFKLQHGVEDSKKLKDVTPTLSKLENLQERWKDDYMANRALRDIFRARKRELQDQQNRDNDFLKKRSLDIPLLQESDDDAKVASLIRLQPAQSVDERQQEKRSEIDKRSQFPFQLLSFEQGASSLITKVGNNETDTSRLQDSQSCLEQRRLSLGIKLKSNATATLTKSTRDRPDQHVNKNETLVSKDIDSVPEKHSGVTNELEKDAIQIQRDNSILQCKSNETTNDSSTIIVHSEGSCRKDTVVAGCSSSSIDQTKNSNRISALVSYSDDSDRNSATSGSENDD